jgi:hypothetical protein
MIEPMSRASRDTKPAAGLRVVQCVQRGVSTVVDEHFVVAEVVSEGPDPRQTDDLARSAGFEVLPGKASAG